MAQARKRIALGFMAVGAMALAGCKAFEIGNPFLPRARILVSADPQVTQVPLVFNQQTGLIQRDGQNNTTTRFVLRPFPGDVTPGVLFDTYTISFKDQNGAKINTLLIPERRLQTSIYVPKGQAAPAGQAPDPGAGMGQGITVEIPIRSEQVDIYGIQNAFTRDQNGAITGMNVEPWNQNLTGVVTFYGRDDNFYPITAEAYFTLRYMPGVTTGG